MGRRARTGRLRPRHRWEQSATLNGSDLEEPEVAELDGLVDVSSKVPEDSVRPTHEPRPRLGISARLAAVVSCLLIAGAGLWWWAALSSPPDVQPVDAARPRPTGKGSEGSSQTGGAKEANDGVPPVIVHVAGAVASPGVYRLRPGSRIHDAITAAGGAAPEADLHRLNLAAPLEDGVRILVPRPGDVVENPQAGTGADSSTASGSKAKVNLNTASVDDLAGLPRVGPVLAQRIVEYRTQHGRFASPEGLDAVPGIGSKMLESLLPLVTV